MELFQLNFPIVSWLDASTVKSEAGKYIHSFIWVREPIPFTRCLMFMAILFEIESVLNKQTNKQKMRYMEWLLHSSNFISLLNSL